MSNTFTGGIHPASHKILTSDRPTKKAFIPRKVVLPLSQHTGSPAEAIAKVGDIVTVGQEIARPTGHVSSSIHASISGKVTRIGYSVTPTLSRSLSITIESDGTEDQDFKEVRGRDIASMKPEELLAAVKAAGIVGLGGASFPTHVKLSPPKTKPIDTVIINGAECEPYLTCDHRLMLERAKEILKGLEIAVKIVGAAGAIVAIEDNKLSAIYAMEQALRGVRDTIPQAKVVAMRTKYPQGAEKQVIKSVLNRAVPAGGLPMDVGCLVQNVGTLYAIYEAVYMGTPLIERLVTITGSCIKEPMNVRVRIGSLIRDLAEYAGGFVKSPGKVIVGGPMMGLAQYTMDVPVVKGTSGILFMSEGESAAPKESVCIRCGKCVDICPMGLVPTALMYNVKKEMFKEAKELGVANCYECGACAYSCPAKIPLLDYMKFGKAKILNV
jgi:electron transport complex protein RnfC